ncbi:MAG TPA: prolyl oligopeptidase family serine peptidase, partial [Gemmataceae bacterium]|nr:prolyl oligopeptidase family serine peptidase [Gemmataceae bacterium]
MQGRAWLISLAFGALMTVTVTTSEGGGDGSTDRAPRNLTDEGPLKYPPTRRGDHFDVYHGVKVLDPYRWLEDDVRKSQEVADWVAEENKVTEAYLKAIPERDALKRRLTDLWNYEKYSAPFKAGSRYFFYKNDGLQNQNVLYWQESLQAPAKVLIDPNTWSKDGTIALSGQSVSDDGKLLAFGKSEAGSDWSKWYVMDVASGKILADELRWVKFTSADWTTDNQGFFYTRYPEPEKGKEFQGLVFNGKLCYHKVGTPQTEDAIVYERPDHKEWGFASDVSEDGNYLIIYTWKGTDRRYRVTYKDLKAKDAKPIDLIDNFEAAYAFLGNNGTTFFFKTDNGAPRSRIVAIDITKPAKEHWKEIIPQAQENMVGSHIVGELFVCNFLKDASTQVKMYRLDGTFVRAVAFPTLGSAGGFGGKRPETETFYTFTSFTTPPTIYRYDLKSGESKLFRQPKVPFEPNDYEVKQVFYQSKDGTRVPMFLSYKKGLKLTRDHPTLLYGYGGFNIPLPPTFAISKLLWMEMGGVYAQANIRGGGEYGKEWHQAAVKLNRQKAYDDFIAA